MLHTVSAGNTLRHDSKNDSSSSSSFLSLLQDDAPVAVDGTTSWKDKDTTDSLLVHTLSLGMFGLKDSS